MKLYISRAVIVIVLFCSPQPSRSAEGLEHAVTTGKNVMVPMRDGVKLATNVFRPDAPGKFPVVMLRTPYGKFELQELAMLLPKSGYACVWQDVRGRFDSEGEWVPFFHEEKDGNDTIEWAVKQPWSNGDVGMVGGSYAAIVQWLAAKSGNPHLKTMISFVGPSDLYSELFHQGGSFIFGIAALWSAVVDGKRTNPGEFLQLLQSPWDKTFEHLPAADALTTLNHDPKYFRDWIAHPTYDAYWRAVNWRDDIPKFNISVLNIGGWFDIFQKGSLEDFRLMSTTANTAVRARQRVIIGPWAHQGQDKSKVGDVDFGPQAVPNLRLLLTEWFDQNLKKPGTPGEASPAVKLFTMGENKWNEYEAWPVPGTKYVDYFFHAKGKANTASGDGLLGIDKPAADEPADTYLYDPANPVPTRGGGNCCWPQVIPWGPYDQREIEKRDDVLVYSTPPLEAAMRVTGPVQVKLWIASSAVDTDFTGKLVDVAPDGYAMNLTDGIQRVAYRKSLEKPEALLPGEPTEITIDLWATSCLFQKGHRIRLEISSSNFPRFSRNLNTGRVPETDSEIRTANQTVFHDAAHPSRVILPILKE